MLNRLQVVPIVHEHLADATLLLAIRKRPGNRFPTRQPRMPALSVLLIREQAFGGGTDIKHLSRHIDLDDGIRVEPGVGRHVLQLLGALCFDQLL